MDKLKKRNIRRTRDPPKRYFDRLHAGKKIKSGDQKPIKNGAKPKSQMSKNNSKKGIK